MDGVRTLESIRTRLRESQPAHLTCAHQFGHHTDSFLDGHRGINAVLVIKIDGVNPHPLQATLTSHANICRRAIHSLKSSILKSKTELGRDDNLLARYLSQEATEKFLVLLRTVDL